MNAESNVQREEGPVILLFLFDYNKFVAAFKKMSKIGAFFLKNFP